MFLTWWLLTESVLRDVVTEWDVVKNLYLIQIGSEKVTFSVWKYMKQVGAYITGRNGGARETGSLIASWSLYSDSRSCLLVRDENKEVVSWGSSLIWVVAQIKHDVTKFACFTSISRRGFFPLWVSSWTICVSVHFMCLMVISCIKNINKMINNWFTPALSCLSWLTIGIRAGHFRSQFNC